MFEVNSEVQNKITDQSRATIGSVSLLGEGAVDITPSPRGTPIPDGGLRADRKAGGGPVRRDVGRRRRASLN